MHKTPQADTNFGASSLSNVGSAEDRLETNRTSVALGQHGERLSRIETKVENIEKNIDEIKSELKGANSNVATLKSDFDVAKGSVLTIKWIIGLGFVGLIISNIADIFLN